MPVFYMHGYGNFKFNFKLFLGDFEALIRTDAKACPVCQKAGINISSIFWNSGRMPNKKDV